MSSENRSIAPKTFESEVPPLKTRYPANPLRKSTASIQDTQKSFSMTTADTLRRAAASSM